MRHRFGGGKAEGLQRTIMFVSALNAGQTITSGRTTSVGTESISLKSLADN